MMEKEYEAYNEVLYKTGDIIGPEIVFNISRSSFYSFIDYNDHLPPETTALLKRSASVVNSLLDVFVGLNGPDIEKILQYMEMEEPDAKAANDANIRVFHALMIRDIARYFRENYIPLTPEIHNYLTDYFSTWEAPVLS